jgi:hypothetical protein
MEVVILEVFPQDITQAIIDLRNILEKKRPPGIVLFLKFLRGREDSLYYLMKYFYKTLEIISSKRGKTKTRQKRRKEKLNDGGFPSDYFSIPSNKIHISK